jgi:predicted TIM-barrel fold metal-dependent hydrolase
MLLDINAHVGHWPFKRLKYNTCAGLLDRMDQFGVDTSVISNLNGVFYKDTQSANEELYDEIRSSKKFTDRFVPFAVMNPSYAGWQNDFKVITSKMGMKGICLYPLYHDYEITDPACVELVQRARDKGLIVTFSYRIVDSRQRSHIDINKEWTLKDIVPIIKKVPDAKYFIVNAANGISVSAEDTQLIKNSKVLFDTSGRILADLGAMLKLYGKDKFAFGTHAPILDYVCGLLRIESLRPEEADEATKELLRSGNAKKMLGI